MIAIPEKHALLYKGILLIALLGSGLLILAFLSKMLLYVQGYEPEDMEGLLQQLHENPGLAQTLVFLQHGIIFILVPMVYVRLLSTPGLRYWSFDWPGWQSLVVFFGLLVIAYPLISIFSLWASMVPWPDWLNNMDKDYVKSLQTLFRHDNLWEGMLTLVLVALLPGIGEELLFRGIIQKELLSVWKNHHVAIWVTAILFSLLHFQASGFPAKCVIGAVLGYAYFHTKTLLIPMMLHAVNNAAAAVALFVSEENLAERPPVPGFSWAQPGLVLLFGTMIYLYYQFFITKRETYGIG